MTPNIPGSPPQVEGSRIKSVTPMVTPEQLLESIKLDDTTAGFIESSRHRVSQILQGEDDRLIVIAGPCSIHNVDEALEFAEKLLPLKDKFPNLEIIMRTYFEKPRTTVGWKGLINDPNLDGSCDIGKGLEIARQLLLDINKKGLPVSTEFLDTISPQYIGDLITWGAIGARTTESQLHRELASGLSAAVGFKNGTTGDIQIAIDAIEASQKSHTFMSATKSGVISMMETTGNPDSHIILRGGGGETNYGAKSIKNTTQRLRESGIKTGIVVDASHANSRKKYKNQPIVSKDVAEQIAAGNSNIVGLMLEANLLAGRQGYNPETDDPKKIKKGISITDECVDINMAEDMLAELNRAVGERRERKERENRSTVEKTELESA